MGKHRKDSRYRRIIMAVVAVGAVGAPTVALACVDWPGGGGKLHHSDAKATTSASWERPDPPHLPYGEADSVPIATPSQTRTAATRAPKNTRPKPKATARPRVLRTAAPKPTATGSPSVPEAIATPTPASTPRPTAPASATPVPASAAPAPASGATARVVELVNAERAKVGCSPLTLNATLAKVAQAHSDDMAAHRNMSHTGSDGSSPGDRITRAGYTWSTYGENVAYGYTTPDQVMAGWISSPGHKANILDCSFKEIGVGLSQPGSYWTQDFGTAR
ncbi:CAP domain-containing protein [Streptomyces sp. NPDC003480]